VSRFANIFLEARSFQEEVTDCYKRPGAGKPHPASSNISTQSGPPCGGVKVMRDVFGMWPRLRATPVRGSYHHAAIVAPVSGRPRYCLKQNIGR